MVAFSVWWRGSAVRRPAAGSPNRLASLSLSSASGRACSAGAAELDGERNAVELAADLRDVARLGIGRRELSEHGLRALDEQLVRRIRRHLSGPDREAGGVSPERLQPMQALALRAKGLAARRQDRDAGAGPEDRLRHARGGAEQVFAPVQDQEALPCREEQDRSAQHVAVAHFDPEGGGDRGRGPARHPRPVRGP
jgi:hypothetical protein